MEPLKLVSAGELLDRHWRAMLAFYAGVFGFVGALFAASVWAWPLAVIAVPFAILGYRARGRLYVPEPGARLSPSAVAFAVLGLVVAFVVFAAVTGLVANLLEV